MKIIRNICIILLLIMLCNCIFNVACAVEQTQKIIDRYTGTVPDEETGTGLSETRKIIGRIITIVQAFGLFIAIAMCISLGIKYMYSAPGDRAQIKNHLTVYIIGAIVMFGSGTILEIIKRFYTKLL